MKRLQRGECRQCCVNLLQVPLANRNGIQHVAILRNRTTQRLGGGQCRLELASLDLGPNSQYLRLNGEGGCPDDRFVAQNL